MDALSAVLIRIERGQEETQHSRVKETQLMSPGTEQLLVLTPVLMDQELLTCRDAGSFPLTMAVFSSNVFNPNEPVTLTH